MRPIYFGAYAREAARSSSQATSEMRSRSCGQPQTRSMLRVRNMVEIVLGALVVIGVFVFWCDVTDSWNNVFLWNKTGKH